MSHNDTDDDIVNYGTLDYKLNVQKYICSSTAIQCSFCSTPIMNHWLIIGELCAKASKSGGCQVDMRVCGKCAKSAFCVVEPSPTVAKNTPSEPKKVSNTVTAQEREDDQPGGYYGVGVCDSPAQFARRFPWYTGDVWFTVVRRIEQPTEHGWRWRKWGDYVGDYDIGVQYLYQADGSDGEPRIDQQWIFKLAKNEQTPVGFHTCTNVLGLDKYMLYRINSGVANSTGEVLDDW